MDQQFISEEQPILEDVRQRFEQWRESRKHRTPIPDSLWEGAVGLCADQSIYRISRYLHLNYNDLKRRVHNAHPERFSEAVASSAFVELDLKPSLPETECFLEMEDKGGTKLKMHVKGQLCFDPLEFMREFLGQRR